MTPTYSEISLLKLVLADYLQVLELHLFAILQMWKTLMLGRGEYQRRGYFNPWDNTGCQCERAWAADCTLTQILTCPHPGDNTFVNTDATSFIIHLLFIHKWEQD